MARVCALVLALVATLAAGEPVRLTDGAHHRRDHRHHSKFATLNVPSVVERRGRRHLPAMKWDQNHIPGSGPPSTLTAHPAVIDSVKGGWVTVTFKNVLFARKNDWIGMWGQHENLTAFKAPSEFKYVWGRGETPMANGTVSFYLVNRRTDYRFVYITGNAEYPEVVAQSNKVTFKRFNVPLGVHLHLVAGGGPAGDTDASRMGIAWNCEDQDKPTVKWGTQSGKYTHSTGVVDSRTYQIDEMCDRIISPAGRQGWFDPGQLLNATMSGLEPGTLYYYTFGDETFGQWSPEYTFRAPPMPVKAWNGRGGRGGRGRGRKHKHARLGGGPAAAVARRRLGQPAAEAEAGDDGGVGRWTPTQWSTQVVAFGDMGNAPTDGSWQHSWDFDNKGEVPSINTTRQIKATLDAAKNAGEGEVDFVLHIGDISYAVGYLSEWDAFQAQIEPIAARVPWMTAVGNHARRDSAEDFARLDALPFHSLRTGFSFPRIPLHFYDRSKGGPTRSLLPRTRAASAGSRT